MSSASVTRFHAPPNLGENAADMITVIKPRNRFFASLNMRTMWRYRELAAVIAMRDLQIRYKQTILGACWAVLQPFAMMVVATVIFGKMLGLAKAVDGYPVFVYAGMVPWTLFASSINASSNSLVSNSEMLRKIYFPRLIIPLAAVGAPVVDSLIAFTILFGLMAWFSVPFTLNLLLLPMLIGSVVLAAVGFGILLSALTVTYRDFRLIIPFMIQLWFFLTPVLYKLTVPESWQWLLYLNPMYGVISAFQSVILSEPMNWFAWLVSIGSATIILAIALAYFSKVERRFADVV